MSIATQIQRLDTAKQEIKTSIEGKGVAVPDSATLSDYPQYIDQIESGGGGVTGAENLVNPQFDEWGQLIGDVVFKENVTSLRMERYLNYRYSPVFTSLSGDGVTVIDTVDSFGGSSYRSSGEYIKSISFKNLTEMRPLGSSTFSNLCNGYNGTEYTLQWDLPKLEIVDCEGFEGTDVRTFPFENLKTFKTSGFRTNMTNDVIKFENIEEFRADGYHLFYSSPVNKIVFGPNLTTVEGNNLFSHCGNLNEIEFKGETPPTFNNNNWLGRDNVKITVPCGAGDTYKSSPAFSSYQDRIVEDCTMAIAYTTNANGLYNDMVIIPKDGTNIVKQDDVPANTGLLVVTESVKILTGSFSQKMTVITNGNIDLTHFYLYNEDSVVYVDYGTMESYRGCPAYDKIQDKFLLKKINGEDVETVYGSGNVDTIFGTYEKLIIGPSANKIESSFRFVEGVKNVQLEYGVKSLEIYGFENITDVSELKLSPSVNFIGIYAFKGMSMLNRLLIQTYDNVVKLEDTEFAFRDTKFDTDVENCSIYVPDGLVDAYKTAENWSKYSNIIKGISDYTSNEATRDDDDLLPED